MLRASRGPSAARRRSGFLRWRPRFRCRRATEVLRYPTAAEASSSVRSAATGSTPSPGSFGSGVRPRKRLRAAHGPTASASIVAEHSRGSGDSRGVTATAAAESGSSGLAVSTVSAWVVDRRGSALSVQSTDSPYCRRSTASDVAAIWQHCLEPVFVQSWNCDLGIGSIDGSCSRQNTIAALLGWQWWSVAALYRA